MSIASLLIEPRLRGLNLESPERIVHHREILAKKLLLRGVFEDFYRLCREVDEKYFTGAEGKRVEIGAGVSLFKSLHPDVLVTDIVPANHLDAVVDAQAMPFEKNSVRAVYGLNCFHHIPSPERFFRELERVLSPHGGCVLIEPYHGPVASVLYKRLFASEGFDKGAPGWEQTAGVGVMEGANQALSYNVFIRDRARFEKLFADLEIVDHFPLSNYVRYLTSGGLNFRSLLPDFFAAPLRAVEFLLTPLHPALALHHTVVLRKRGQA